MFTGAAACAALFTPGAATAATAKAGRMEPDISHKNCGHAATTSMHFYWPPSAKHGPTCVGGRGSTSLGGTVFSAVCTGANSGYFILNGEREYFGAAENISLDDQRVYKVEISETHLKTAECPYSR